MNPESCMERLGEVKRASKLASSRPDGAWKQTVESASAAEETSRHLMKVPSRSRHLEGGFGSLKAQMSGCVKTRDDATSLAIGQNRHSNMLEDHIDLLKKELGLLKRKESTGCDMDAELCKVADAKHEIKELFGGLRWETFTSYASIRYNVDQSLLTVSSRLVKVFDRKAKDF